MKIIGNNKRRFHKESVSLTITLIFSLAFIYYGASQESSTVDKSFEYYVAAYIWPSAHNDSLAQAKLWSDGIGEWEVIKQGDPRFKGHYQPRRPYWGYEMDDDPKVVEKWIDTASKNGINVFVYDWYWFDNYPFLEGALNDGFLKARNNHKMYFYLMWANHDVKYNYWNYHKYKDNTDLLFHGAVDWETYKVIVDRVINRYFKKDNYLKIDGEPVFSIFSKEKLLESFNGDLSKTRKALDYFRQEVKRAGFPGLHLQLNNGGGDLMSDEEAVKYAKEVEDLGFDSVAMYNMGGMDEDYIQYGANSLKIREQMDSLVNVPVFPCVSIGWDDTPRFPSKGKKDVVHYHNTPRSFELLLSKAKEYVDNHPNQPRIININAWNEWVEGSYLLPDMLNGFDYLKAVKEVMLKKADSIN